MAIELSQVFVMGPTSCVLLPNAIKFIIQTSKNTKNMFSFLITNSYYYFE